MGKKKMTTWRHGEPVREREKSGDERGDKNPAPLAFHELRASERERHERDDRETSLEQLWN